MTNVTSELPIEENNELKTINEKNSDVKEQDTNGVSKTGAVLLLNELVTKAASAANDSRLQNDFNSLKF